MTRRSPGPRRLFLMPPGGRASLITRSHACRFEHLVFVRSPPALSRRADDDRRAIVPVSRAGMRPPPRVWPGDFNPGSRFRLTRAPFRHGPCR